MARLLDVNDIGNDGCFALVRLNYPYPCTSESEWKFKLMFNDEKQSDVSHEGAGILNKNTVVYLIQRQFYNITEFHQNVQIVPDKESDAYLDYYRVAPLNYTD